MIKPVFDTNILIDALCNVDDAKEEIERYSHIYISVITWMEVLAGAKNKRQEKIIRDFLATFELIELDENVREAAINIRKKQKIKLPDAIILASAQSQNTILVTRNIKDFSAKDPSIRIPYKL